MDVCTDCPLYSRHANTILVSSRCNGPWPQSRPHQLTEQCSNRTPSANQSTESRQVCGLLLYLDGAPHIRCIVATEYHLRYVTANPSRVNFTYNSTTTTKPAHNSSCSFRAMELLTNHTLLKRLPNTVHVLYFNFTPLLTKANNFNRSIWWVVVDDAQVRTA